MPSLLIKISNEGYFCPINYVLEIRGLFKGLRKGVWGLASRGNESRGRSRYEITIVEQFFPPGTIFLTVFQSSAMAEVRALYASVSTSTSVVHLQTLPVHIGLQPTGWLGVLSLISISSAGQLTAHTYTNSTQTHRGIHRHTDRQTDTHTPTYTHINMCAPPPPNSHAHTHTNEHTQKHTHKWTHRNTHTRCLPPPPELPRTHTHTHIQINTDTQTHKHTHTHTHTHTQSTHLAPEAASCALTWGRVCAPRHWSCCRCCRG